MADWTTSLADWSVRGAGALAGASVSLVYMLPKRRREALSRLAVGMIAGLIFGHAAGEWLVSWFGTGLALDRLEILLIGATSASFASWWALGVIVRILDRAGTAQDPASSQSTSQKGESKDAAR